MVDGRVVAEGRADFPRTDLRELGLGQGTYGFTLDLPPQLIDGQHHLVEVKARVNGKLHPLTGGSRLQLFDLAQALKGHVVIENDGLVHGWALNSASPDAATAVVISAGPGYTIELNAEQYRPDLAELKLGNGCHGFQAVLPWDWYEPCTKDGRLKVDVRFKTSDTAVPGSPLTLHVVESYKARAAAQSRTPAPLPIAGPLISIVMPVYNPPPAYLEAAIESVRQQSYPNWQLCIADDASPDPAVRDLLQQYAKHDARIQLVFRQENGNISRASNSALELVQGSHFALLDHDDLLHPDALLHVAHAIHAKPELGMIFSDEDKCTAIGQRYGPYHKAGWDRELLMGQNCVSHLGVFQTELVKQLGGFRTGYEGSQDYDLALRASRQLSDEQILHIPRVLYHWRAIPGSTALANSEKSYARVAMRKALQSHLRAIGLKAAIEPVQGGVFYRVVPKLPKRLPSLSVLWIVTPDTGEAQAAALLAGLHWPGVQIVCAAPAGKLLPDAAAYCTSQPGNLLLRYDPAVQNTPDLLETMLEHATGSLCLCVTEAIAPSRPQTHWLAELAAHALRDDVGFACPRVHNDEITVIQAASQTNAAGELVPRYVTTDINDAGPGGAALLNHQTDALVAAIFMCSKQALQQAFIGRYILPALPWQQMATCTLKGNGKSSIVLPQLLFKLNTTADILSAAGVEMPWFSIILPTYNRRDLLPHAIDSALRQHYQNFELIIVDDGSTDGTEAMLRSRYAAEITSGKLVYRKLEYQSGVSQARNQGLAHARYPWIAYLDSDNQMRPEFLALFANATMKHPEKTAFYAHFQPTSGKPVVGKPFNYGELQQANYIDLGVFIHAQALTDAGGGFDAQLKRLVDWDLILRLTLNNEPVYLPYTVLDYHDQERDDTRISVRESFEAAKQILVKKSLVTP